MCGEVNNGCLSFSLTEETLDFSAQSLGGLCVFTLSTICTIADIEERKEQLLCLDGELKTIDNKDIYVLRWDIG